jgi:hypothetical protein
MYACALRPIILPMTRPTPSSKVLLVESPFRRGEAPEPAPAVVKRHRLARLRFDGRAGGHDCRYEQLKRVYD